MKADQLLMKDLVTMEEQGLDWSGWGLGQVVVCAPVNVEMNFQVP